jgi:DNA primase
LRVVPLPAGRDPADLVATEGADAVRDRVERAVPFADFQVQRILERADVRSVEGRDRAVRELRPVFAGLRPGLLRDELSQRVAGMLSLNSAQLARLLLRDDRPRRREPARKEVFARGRASQEPLDPAVRGERAFLALCIAQPEAGQKALRQIELDEHVTSTRLRRAAHHLSGRLKQPLGGLPADDEELARTVADLVARAGRAGEVLPERVEQQRLYLELARLDRAIRRARTRVAVGAGSFAGAHGADGQEGAQGGEPQEAERGAEVQRLAREKEAVRAAIRELDARLERPV